GDLQLAWTNPPVSSGFAVVRVVRKAGATPRTPSDGVAIFTGPGTGTAEPLAGMGFGAWTYAVFACNGCGVCNDSPATVGFNRAPPADAGMDGGTGGGGGSDGGTLTPTHLTLQLAGDGKNVLMSWSNPPEVTEVKVLRTLNSPAIGPGDSSATVVFQGNASSASERVDRLLPNVAGSPATWHYRVYGCKSASCETAGVETTLALTLGQALRGGGYTLFWRHATANVCGDQTQLGPASSTTQPDWWRSCDKNCATAYARQIDTVQAPNETATVHTAFATRGFTVGKVLSSEFCRAVQTAQGFAFGPQIELSQALTYFVYDEGQRCTQTMALLNTPPPPGTNTALVSHAGFTCAIIDSLAWGEAAIYRPIGTGAPKYLGRVPWNGWTALP
ncbi:MAG: Phosphoglycerate mutase, partial [Myxococcaceae bacterium]|nr:Phosphoglycerate mutase [Myxococcaceae bacterium]